MATHQKTTRAAKLSTASKSANSHQRTESEDVVENDSANKSYTGEDIDSNGSDDNNDVPLSVIQQEKEKKKQSAAPKRRRQQNCL
jgi:hypothetical protein